MVAENASLVVAPVAGACSDCGGALPLGRQRGRCGTCLAALGREAKLERRGRAVVAVEGPLAELQALQRCVVALDALPTQSRTRALKYLWAIYGGQPEQTGRVESR